MTELLLVEDDSLKLMLLTFLVSKFEKGAFDELIKAGLVTDRLDALHALSSSDLLRLSKAKALRLSVHVDGASLERCLTQMGQHRSRCEKQAYFMTHHASPAMMVELFRMGYQEQDNARVALGVVKARQAALDEWVGQLRQKTRSGKPVINRLGYLNGIVRGARLGQFCPTVGLQIASEREVRQLGAASLEQRAEDVPASRAVIEQNLSQIRALLGTRGLRLGER
ncbi:MAG: STY4526/YPO1902 family pathogenicity island replication protein [Thiobacillaceae bacterium]